MNLNNPVITELVTEKLKQLYMPNDSIAPAMQPAPSDNHTVMPNSQLMSVSIRGWITLIVVFTVCLMSVMKIVVVEPLYTMTGMIIAFYFGQNTNNKPSVKQ